MQSKMSNYILYLCLTDYHNHVNICMMQVRLCNLHHTRVSMRQYSMGNKNLSESQEQQALFSYFRQLHPEILMFSIPNGGSRNKLEAIKLKREGVLSGVLDIFISEARNGFHGLYIEMKVKPNKPTPRQADFIRMASSRGYKCGVCYSWEEAKDMILEYLEANKYV